MIGRQPQLFEIFPDRVGVCGVYQLVNILSDDDKVFVLVASAEMPGQLVMTMDIANFKLPSGHRTLTELSAVRYDKLRKKERRT